MQNPSRSKTLTGASVSSHCNDVLLNKMYNFYLIATMKVTVKSFFYDDLFGFNKKLFFLSMFSLPSYSHSFLFQASFLYFFASVLWPYFLKKSPLQYNKK